MMNAHPRGVFPNLSCLPTVLYYTARDLKKENWFDWRVSNCLVMKTPWSGDSLVMNTPAIQDSPLISILASRDSSGVNVQGSCFPIWITPQTSCDSLFPWFFKCAVVFFLHFGPAVQCVLAEDKMCSTRGTVCYFTQVPVLCSAPRFCIYCSSPEASDVLFYVHQNPKYLFYTTAVYVIFYPRVPIYCSSPGARPWVLCYYQCPGCW